MTDTEVFLVLVPVRNVREAQVVEACCVVPLLERQGDHEIADIVAAIFSFFRSLLSPKDQDEVFLLPSPYPVPLYPDKSGLDLPTGLSKLQTHWAGPAHYICLNMAYCFF